MSINVNSELQIELNQADNVFVNLISNRITAYGAIPYTVPRKLIIDIIQLSARLFYRYAYHACQEHKALVLTQTEVSNYFIQSGYTIKDGFKFIGVEIQLPSYVSVVKEVYKSNENIGYTVQEMTANMQLLQQSTTYGNTIIGINNNMYIQEVAARMIETNANRAVFGKGLMFHYSTGTHRIIFYESEFPNALILDCLVNAPVEILYNDDLFTRHVIAETKRELKRILGGHTIQLPGDVTLNVDEICNNIEDAEKVEELVKNSSGIGHIILQR
jgi:hypothetical protein